MHQLMYKKCFGNGFCCCLYAYKLVNDDGDSIKTIPVKNI